MHFPQHHPPSHPHPWEANRNCKDTYEKQQAFVLTDGTAAAEETQQKEHCSHSQHDVRSREEQGVGSHYLSKTCGIHNDPDPDSQQTCSSQLSRHKERREREIGRHKKNAAEKLDSLPSFDQRRSLGEFVFLHGTYSPRSRRLLTRYSSYLLLTKRAICSKTTFLPWQVTLPTVYSLPNAERLRLEVLPRL